LTRIYLQTFIDKDTLAGIFPEGFLWKSARTTKTARCSGTASCRLCNLWT